MFNNSQTQKQMPGQDPETRLKSNSYHSDDYEIYRKLKNVRLFPFSYTGVLVLLIVFTFISIIITNLIY